MSTVTLFHDGCNVCLGISATMAAAFIDGPRTFESVDLSIDTLRAKEAAALGVLRLPSLVIDGRVLRLEDHSSIAHGA